MNEPLLTLLHPEYSKLAGGDLRAPLPLCNALACSTAALRRRGEGGSSTRDALRLWLRPSGQGLTPTQRQMPPGHASCSLRAPQRVWC